MSQPFYAVEITRITEDPRADGQTKLMTTTSQLTLRADALHEIAPMLAALYPPPIVKRSHRRKKEAQP